MPSGYRYLGVDWDDLFDPYVTGTPPAATGFRSLGVDTAGRYAPIAFGSLRADVLCRIASAADVKTLWAAKGTAQYVSSDCGLPLAIVAEANGTSGPLTATCLFNIFRDGTTSWSPPSSSGVWYQLAPPNIGDQYEVRFTQTATNGLGVLTATLGTWMQLSATRTVQLSATRSISGEVRAERTILVEIRRVGDVSAAASRSVDMESIANIS